MARLTIGHPIGSAIALQRKQPLGNVHAVCYQIWLEVNMYVSAGALRYSTQDDELGSRVFRCSDPENLDNILLNPPAGGEGPQIEFQYDVTPPKGVDRPYIRCAHCGYPTHWLGFVLLYPNRARILVGKDCGEKLYGASFAQIARHFTQAETRQLQLARLESVNRAYIPFLRFLLALQQHPSVRQVNILLSDMEVSAKSLLRLLQSSSRHNA